MGIVYNAAMETANQLPLESDERFAAFAGRWVAVVRGRVVGLGRTAAEARLMARRACPKDEPVVLLVPERGLRAGQ